MSNIVQLEKLNWSEICYDTIKGNESHVEYFYTTFLDTCLPITSSLSMLKTI